MAFSGVPTMSVTKPNTRLTKEHICIIIMIVSFISLCFKLFAYSLSVGHLAKMTDAVITDTAYRDGRITVRKDYKICETAIRTPDDIIRNFRFFHNKVLRLHSLQCVSLSSRNTTSASA